ncbi:hypothetical protein [Amaricoccus solimangrovi]|uniref:Uncharacterized protein n=1 Tax=Amaricoccus solimangrovi TaxID=2589815 RepID=A0A501WLS2_9RHOB|nr:hypothetical protein [Amaricoccus solimangrovi]TPE50429.1 hypothetical protein FJM51_11570 [Amaricoccus solimangrovi]
MLKVATTVILIGLLVGMVIRSVLPRPPAASGGKRRVETARKCPVCGAYRLGDGRCPTPGCPSGR